MKIEYFKKPVWANAEHTSINMLVKFEEFTEELPFNACSTDCEAHGVELFNRALASEVGEILPFVPVVISDLELAIKVRTKREMILTSTDWTQIPDVPQITKDKWLGYRQELRDITLQSGFPIDIVWPITPV